MKLHFMNETSGTIYIPCTITYTYTYISVYYNSQYIDNMNLYGIYGVLGNRGI